MKKITVFLIVLAITGISHQAFSQTGIGLRFGDPSGITVKKYMGSNAFEVSIGRTWWHGDRWYDKRFNDWYYDQKYNYVEFQYLGYGATVPIALQLHYLFQKDAGASGLQWYYGFGAQFRYQRYEFDYRYKVSGDPNWHYDYRRRATDLDLGADGVIGLEYTFSDVPIALFLDATAFIELIDDPFIFWFQGGAGIRVNL